PSFPTRRSSDLARIESELASAFKNLYAELREKFQLTADDLPHPPRERMKRCRASALRASPRPGNRSGCPTIQQDRLHRIAASGIDGFLCVSINLLHIRHRLNGCSRDEMERYVGA